MKDISVILKNNTLVTIDEFNVLRNYTISGRMWSLTQIPTRDCPFVTRLKVLEYIFDEESLTRFCIMSTNILATWNTDCTRHLGPNDEFRIKETLFIRPLV